MMKTMPRGRARLATSRAGSRCEVQALAVALVLSLVLGQQVAQCGATERTQGGSTKATTHVKTKVKTSLDGPFPPVTVPFAFKGAPSMDLPGYDPLVVKRVEGVYPEQIMLALSTPDAMWLSWITGQ